MGSGETVRVMLSAADAITVVSASLCFLLFCDGTYTSGSDKQGHMSCVCMSNLCTCWLFLPYQVSEATTSVEVEVAVIPPFPFLVPVKDQVCVRATHHDQGCSCKVLLYCVDKVEMWCGSSLWYILRYTWDACLYWDNFVNSTSSSVRKILRLNL